MSVPRIGIFPALLRCIAFLLAGFLASGSRAEPAAVVVLTGGDSGVYADTLEGFQDRLRQEEPAARVRVHVLPAAEVQQQAFIAQIRAERPSLLLTLGGGPTALASDELPEVPLVAGLVTRRALPPPGRNATGVTLEFPVEVELEWLRRFFPGRRAIGVLFDPAINRDRIAIASKAARKLGIKLVPYEVSSPRALPGTLKAVSRSIDALWGLTDSTVLSPATAKSILIFSYRHRIPLTGLSDAWTDAGALYSLERDYSDIGRQCAEIATRILRGARAGSLPPKSPRKIVYSVNLKAADHMRIEIPKKLVANASRVVQ